MASERDAAIQAVHAMYSAEVAATGTRRREAYLAWKTVESALDAEVFAAMSARDTALAAIDVEHPKEAGRG